MRYLQDQAQFEHHCAAATSVLLGDRWRQIARTSTTRVETVCDSTTAIAHSAALA